MNAKNTFLQAINSLVFENYNVSEAILELQNENDENKFNGDLALISFPDDTPWLSEGLKSATRLAKVLIDCLKDSDSSDIIYITDLQMKKVKTTVSLTQDAMKNEFAIEEYSKLLSSQENMPLQILCYLQSKDVLSIEKYLLCNLSKSSTIAQFTKSVVQLFVAPQMNLESSNCMSREVMYCLVNCMFGRSFHQSGNEKNAVYRVCNSVLDSVLHNAVISSLSDTTITLNMRINVIAVVLEDMRVSDACKSALCAYIQKTILTSNPTVKVSQALAEQHLWLYKLASPYFVDVLQKSFVSSELSEVVGLLKSLVQHQEVNWKMLLVFISTCLVFFKQASVSSLSELVETLLQQAFTNLHLDSLITGFLIGRQMAMESPPIHISYSDWFQKYFGDSQTSYLHSNSPKNVAFLIKFLTSLVPHEQAIYLKAHIMKPPNVVPRCRTLWNDYIKLAKTRLIDLKEPIEELSIYSKDTNVVHKQGEQADNDVERSLELFQTSGKIPSTVFEASIFRKSYFNGHFLVSLLKPRILPDIHDTRMKFINELKQAGKIPTLLYEEYIQKCQNEAAGLFEEVAMDDDFIEELVIEPSVDFKNALSNLSKQLRKPDVDAEVGPAIALVSSKLQCLLETFQDNPSPVMKQDYNISVNDLDSSKDQTREVVNEIVKMFAEASTLATRSNKWDFPFVSMLSCHNALHVPLAKYLWRYFTHEKEVPLKVGLIVLLQRIGCIFPNIHRNGLVDDLPSLIFQFFPVQTFSERQYFLELSSKYFDVARERSDVTNRSPMLLKKFQYAFLTEHKHNWNSVSNFDSVYKEVERTGVKLTIEEWLNFEKQRRLELQPYETLESLRFWVYDYFQSNRVENWETICSHILAAHLNIQSISTSLFPLLILLQEIVVHLPYNAPPLLLNCFDKLFPTTACSSPIELQHKFQSFVSIVCCLSPHIMFSNNLNQVSEDALGRLSKILQGFAREYVTDTSLLKHLTRHIWQGFRLLDNTHKDHIDRFLRQTPTFRAATIVHFRHLARDNSKIPYLNALDALFQNISKGEPIAPHGMEIWEIGLAMSTLFPTTIQSTSEVQAYSLLFAIVHNKEVTHNIASLLKNSPPQTRERCCRPKSYMQISGKMQTIMPTHSWQLYPYYLLRIISKMWEENAVSDLWWLTVILENFQQCKTQLAVNLEFLLESRRRLENILRHIPADDLKAIPKELWEECDLRTQIKFVNT